MCIYLASFATKSFKPSEVECCFCLNSKLRNFQSFLEIRLRFHLQLLAAVKVGQVLSILLHISYYTIGVYFQVLPVQGE
jgi:hypothetical protein